MKKILVVEMMNGQRYVYASDAEADQAARESSTDELDRVWVEAEYAPEPTGDDVILGTYWSSAAKSIR